MSAPLGNANEFVSRQWGLRAQRMVYANARGPGCFDFEYYVQVGWLCVPGDYVPGGLAVYARWMMVVDSSVSAIKPSSITPSACPDKECVWAEGVHVAKATTLHAATGSCDGAASI